MRHKRVLLKSGDILYLWIDKDGPKMSHLMSFDSISPPNHGIWQPLQDLLDFPRYPW